MAVLPHFTGKISIETESKPQEEKSHVIEIVIFK